MDCCSSFCNWSYSGTSCGINRAKKIAAVIPFVGNTVIALTVGAIVGAIASKNVATGLVVVDVFDKFLVAVASKVVVAAATTCAATASGIVTMIYVIIQFLETFFFVKKSWVVFVQLYTTYFKIAYVYYSTNPMLTALLTPSLYVHFFLLTMIFTRKSLAFTSGHTVFKYPD